MDKKRIKEEKGFLSHQMGEIERIGSIAKEQRNTS